MKFHFGRGFTGEVPEGTVVKTRMNDNAGATLETPPYADGVVVISDSMYSDWIVVLQGRGITGHNGEKFIGLMLTATLVRSEKYTV